MSESSGGATRRGADNADPETSRLQALLDLHEMVDASAHEITDFALESGVRLTGSEIGYLAFMNEDETVLTMHSWSKTAMKQCAIIDKPIVYPVADTGLWGEVVRQRRPVITNDYGADNARKKGYPEGHVRVRRHMNVPGFDRDRIVLVAGVGNKQAPYDESDTRQLTLLMKGMWQLLRRREIREELRRRTEELSRAHELLAEQHEEILELSSPAIQLWEGMVLVPLVGTLDSHRAHLVTERLLDRVVETRASVVIVDVTGVPAVDSATAGSLIEAAAALRLLGARMVLTGIRPAIAQTLVRLGVDLSSIETCPLSRGVHLAFEHLGFRVVKGVLPLTQGGRKVRAQAEGR